MASFPYQPIRSDELFQDPQEASSCSENEQQQPSKRTLISLIVLTIVTILVLRLIQHDNSDWQVPNSASQIPYATAQQTKLTERTIPVDASQLLLNINAYQPLNPYATNMIQPTFN